MLARLLVPLIVYGSLNCHCFGFLYSHYFPYTLEPSLHVIGGGGTDKGDNQKGTMRYVLVTGSSRGIGKAICRQLLEQHKDIAVFLGSRSIERGHAAARELQLEIDDEDLNRNGRLIVIPLDVTSDESLLQAVGEVQKHTNILYGIINNAGVKLPDNVTASVDVNYFGPRRVNEVFSRLMQKPGGRIIHLASEFSAPNFVSSCTDSELRQKLTYPWTIKGGVQELDSIARDPNSCSADNDAYGFSKALVCAYTWLLANEEPSLLVNSVTPGFVKTDMTKGSDAVDPPSKGAGPPIWLLLAREVQDEPTGRFYGSDCKRSPLDKYRRPGQPAYEGPDGKEVML